MMIWIVVYLSIFVFRLFLFFNTSVRKKDTTAEIELKKVYQESKVKLEQDRMEKYYSYKLQKLEEKAQLQYARFLEEDYHRACEKYAKEEDEFLKTMYEKEVKDANATWKNYQNQIVGSNLPELPGGVSTKHSSNSK